MSGTSSEQKNRSRKGYRRLLSHQFSFNQSGKSEEKAAAAAAGKAKKKKKSEGLKLLHPLLSVLDARNKEKAAMKPEFLRYLEYLKEAGTWDSNSDRPTIYYF